MSLPRWAGRYEQKAKRLIKRLHSLVKRKPEEAFWLPSERREYIRFDVVVKNPLNGIHRNFSVQCISPVPDTAVRETDRKRDIERCASEMATLLHQEGCKYCIDRVFVMTSPVDIIDRPVDFKYNLELSKKFLDLLMSEMTSLDEAEAKRRCFERVSEFLVRRFEYDR